MKSVSDLLISLKHAVMAYPHDEDRGEADEEC